MTTNNKKTLVLGASPNPSRYSYKAVMQLTNKGHEAVAFGIRDGMINDVVIQNELPQDNDFDTITLYLSPSNQKTYYDYILDLTPKRIIFNPGTENPELIQLAKAAGIEVEIACTLVLLQLDGY